MPTVYPELQPSSALRRRLRRDDIKRAAMAQLHELGPGRVSMRGIGRAMDMTPSSLYRFFDDLDALLGELRADAVDQVSLVLREAHRDVAASASSRWACAATGFRTWALGHPDEFALIYYPYASYGPAWSPPAGIAVNAPLARLADIVRAGMASGELVPSGAIVGAGVTASGHDPSCEISVATLGATLTMAQVSLEVFGHLGDVARDPGALFRAQTRAVMEQMGFTSTPESLAD